MTTLLTTLFLIALVDSTSMIPIGTIPLAVILGGKRPFPCASGFLAGIFVAYALAGVLIYFGLDAVFTAVLPYALRLWNQPNTPELIVQLVLGAALLYAAWTKYRSPAPEMEKDTSPALSPWGAFATGFTLTVIGIPGAVPYFGAVDQILRADLPISASLGAIMFYSLAFLTPFLALLLVRAVSPAQSERIFRACISLVQRWGKTVAVGALAALGITFIADGIGWFMGVPLLPVAVDEVAMPAQSNVM